MLKWRKEFRCLFFICILFIQDNPVMKFKVSISLCFIIDKADAFDVQKVYFLPKSGCYKLPSEAASPSPIQSFLLEHLSHLC